MKKIVLQLSLICLGMLALLASCEDDNPTLASPPAETVADFSYTRTTRSPNQLKFTGAASTLSKQWIFGNGVTGSGDELTVNYPYKGTYEVTLTAYTAGGRVTSKQTINILEDDLTLLEIPEFTFLTGGIDAADGKTWIVDKDMIGHLGVGSSVEAWPNWYQANPNDKADRGLYDDEFNFKLLGLAFDGKTNNSVYVNGAFSATFAGAVKEPVGDDYIAPYTPPTGQTWSLVQEGTKWFLTISNGGFMGYYSGPAPRYEIVSITADEMQLRSIQGGNDANAWYQRFIRKGFVREVEEPEPEPEPEYKIEDIFTNFDGAGNVTFAANSGGTVVPYDNPAPVPINETAKVGKYVKAGGSGGAFSNVQIQLPYKMDLRQRHIFKLKVFLPGYNDYTTDNGAEVWQTYRTLQKQVSLKLQNRTLGGDSWTTQLEVAQRTLETDKWLELTFDFSAAADRTDFDTVIIQIGGEAIYTGGIFFIDDLALQPAAQ